jgi:hypothetical protein
MRTKVTRLQLCCMSLGWMLVLYGCSSGTTSKGALIKSSKHVESSAAELGARDQSLLGRYSAEIETAADKIIFESPSPITRRQALVWKAEAIPALQTSLLNIDPLAAAIDTWAFIFQMQAYMNQPKVKQGWGEFYPVVTETLNRMESEMEQLLRTVAPSGNMDAARQKVESWAKENPIEVSLADRKSADADLIQRTDQSDLRARASLKAITESIGDLTARMDSFNTYLPKQARWQAELMLSDLARNPQIDAAMSNAAALSSTLEKTSGSIEQIPEFVGQLQKTTLANIDTQRVDTQGFLRQERLQTLDAIKQERIATLAALRSERLAATADFRGERQIVLDALHNEQAAIMNDLDSTSEKWLASFDTRARGLIDHFFLRGLELVLIVVALCSLVAWLLMRRFAGGRRDRGERLYDRAA